MELRGVVDEYALLDFPAGSNLPAPTAEVLEKWKVATQEWQGSMPHIEKAFTQLSEGVTQANQSLRQTAIDLGIHTPVYRDVWSPKKRRAKLKKQKRKNGGPR